jgi:hypothetical protein
MRYQPIVSGLAIALAFAAFAPSAVAQETYKLTCQDVGGAPPEPLGDRDGHAIQVEEYSCRVDAGVLAGGVVSGENIWEWDKTNAVLVSGEGVIRKPGATTAFRITEGNLALTMADGKVTGSTASGRGNYSLAIGSAASLAGRPFSFSSMGTGPGEFEVDGKQE